MLRYFWVCIVFMVVGCNKSDQAGSQRPVENWVFRSVLDLQPRILTIALHNNLWVAYHTKTGAMYKAWKGNVMFDGPVSVSYTHLLPGVALAGKKMKKW